MLAAQLVAAHSAIMECYIQAAASGTSAERRFEYLNRAARLSSAFTKTLETLNKYRGKGQQKVTVEHVHIHSGGQAVVGVVETIGEGGSKKLEEQPHAKQQVDAREPALLRSHEAGNLVPVSSNGEWPLQDARR